MNARSLRWASAIRLVALGMVCGGSVFGAMETESAGVARGCRAKTSFLVNLPRFVDWPTNVFADATSPLVIGVLGRNPFCPDLAQIMSGKKVGGRELKLRWSQRVEDLMFCHVLFISRSEKERLPQILSKLAGAR